MTSVLLVGDIDSIHMRRVASALASRELRVAVAAFEGPDLDGISSHRLGSLPVEADRRYLLGVPRLAQVMRRTRPDVVNAHYLTSYGVMAALAMRLAFPLLTRPPLVQTVWGDDLLVTPEKSVLHRSLARLALRWAAMVTGDSDDLAAAAHRLAPATPWQKIVFGPPEALLHAPAVKERLIISARHLLPEMRVGLIVKAFAELRRRFPDEVASWRLIVAGSGPEEEELATAVSVNGGAVEMAGKVSHDELAALLLRASVQVSIPRSDATSATLLEGLAAGALPVVNDLPANREWVDPSVGIVVPRDPTPDDLVGALRTAITSEPSIKSLRQRVVGVTWESQVDILADLFDRLAAEAR
jgi:glycosyltransferase involved in cell wall biosynthesis